MGLGKIFGGIGKGLLGLLPGGGTISAIADVAGGMAPILGGAAKGAQESTILQDRARLDRDRLQQERFRTNQALPGQRLSTAIGASKAANFSPVTASWGGPGSGKRGELTRFSGGFANPNLIDPRVKQQADDILNQQLLAQMQREQAPEISQPMKEGKGSKILGGLALGSSILGGLGGVKFGKSKAQFPEDGG